MAIKNKKSILTLSVLTILFVIVSEVIYLILTREVIGADVNMAHRGIETTDKLIFNGVIGQFFRITHFGALNLLIIPFLFSDLFKFRSLEQWQKAFLFLYISILALIGIKGFFNPRYSLTIFPISTIYLFYSIWNIKKHQLLKKEIIPYFLVFIAALFFSKELALKKVNDTFYQDHLLPQKYDGIKNGLELNSNENQYNLLEAMQLAVFNENLPDYKHNPHFFKAYPNYSQEKIFNFIRDNHKNGSQRIITNNLPSVYYYTDANALYYWSGDDLIFDGNGRYSLFKNRTNGEVKTFLLDSMNVGYIYTYEPYNKYFDEFHTFLKEECELIEQNYSTYQIFKLREKAK